MSKETHIVIIGAGMAGLAAARTLLAKQFKVTIVEARDRIGGRTWTDYSWNMPIDLGAFIIHGIDGNPMTTLAQKFHARFHTIAVNTVYFPNKHLILSGTERDNIETQFLHLLQKAGDYARSAEKDISLQDSMSAVFQQAEYPLLSKSISAWRSLFISLYTGADKKYLSARHWDEDEIMLEGGHGLMLDGYAPIVNGLAEGISIHLNTCVEKIHYHDSDVKIVTNKGDYHADAVIVTLPLGILKNQPDLFDPILPEIKRQSISRLAMGVLNKIALNFPKPFWPTDIRFMIELAESYPSLAWFNNFYPDFNRPVLIGFTGGDVARALEKLDDKAMQDEAMQKLRSYFGNAIPNPTASLITRWGQDPYTLGSYSYIPVGASGQDYDILAQPVGNTLFFAGEATHRQHPGMTHGAYLSGVREAEHIIKQYT